MSKTTLLLSFLGVVSSSLGVEEVQPNPPQWPKTVNVFTPSDDQATIQSVVDEAFALNGGQNPDDHGEFSSHRFAFLFQPGTYSVEVPVGYYTSVYGLGSSPNDVIFNSGKGVYCEQASGQFTIGALDTFWRSAENFMNDVAYEWWSGAYGSLWAVSQASPLRRVHTTSDLYLFEYENDGAGYASGGFLSDSQIDGTVYAGSQQQWFTRNSQVGGWNGGVWNLVFSGVNGAPDAQCGSSYSTLTPPHAFKPDGIAREHSDRKGVDTFFNGRYTTFNTAYVTVDETPLIAEKPYITFDSSLDTYSIVRPAFHTNTAGPIWENEALSSEDDVIGFEHVYVTDNTTDTASSMNEALSLGLHLVITPGVYWLDETLTVQFDGQMILGLGLATLIPTQGNSVIQVLDDLTNVRVAGLLLEAGAQTSSSLFQWGTSSSISRSSQAIPAGVMSDIFARVGGPVSYETSADTMVHINTDGVIGDNLWLWRADHTVDGLVYNSSNPCFHGLQVDGDDVIMYGLAAEHTLQDLTVWNGENGATFFYQSELPYDATQDNFGNEGYVGYRVASHVQNHTGHGIGVYHFFRDYAVTVASGISSSSEVMEQFNSPLTVFLNGLGTITHIINDEGATTNNSSEMVEWFCDYSTPI